MMVHYSLVYHSGENFVKFCRNFDIKKMEKKTLVGTHMNVEIVLWTSKINFLEATCGKIMEMNDGTLFVFYFGVLSFKLAYLNTYML